MAGIATYSTDGKCTHVITLFKDGLGRVYPPRVSKKHANKQEALKWVQKWHLDGSNIKDLDDSEVEGGGGRIEEAVDEYNEKFRCSEDKSRAILDFVTKFLKAFPESRTVFCLELTVNDTVWHVVKGKASKKATEAEIAEFKKYSEAYKANPGQFMKDNFKLTEKI